MSNELAHYGVKGMKWGKRKKTVTSSQEAYEKTLKDYNVQKSNSSSGVKVTSGWNKKPSESVETWVVNGRTYQTTASGAKKIHEDYKKAMAYGTAGGGGATTDAEFEEAVRKKAEEQKKKKKALDFLSKSKKLKSKSKLTTTSVKDKVTSFLNGLGKKKKKGTTSSSTKLITHSDEFIVHYGVPGMKWGVRKARPTSGKRRGKTNAQRIYEHVTRKKETPKATTKTSSKPAKRRISDMSDEELRSAISRMQMERTYAQLTAKEVSKGRKFVKDVMYNSAKNVATKATTAAMENALKKLTNRSSSGGGP